MAEAVVEEKDDLRGDLASALAGVTTESTDTGAANANAGNDHVRVENDGSAGPGDGALKPEDARARDEQGRFAKAEEAKKRETLALKPKEAPAVAAKPGSEGSTPQAAVAAPAVAAAAPSEGAAPPIEWKGDAKVDWARLPKGVQAAIRETYDGIQKANAEVAPLKEMIDINRPLLVREAGSVQEGMRQLFAFHQASVDNPVNLCAYILRARGIDPATAFTGQPAQTGTPQPQQNLQAFIAQLVQQQLQPIQAQFQQQESQTYTSQIDSFAADPANPYFNDVKAHMAALLKGGQAKSLQDAYDQATWANPVIRTQLLARQSEDAANAKAAEVAKAQAAQRASLTGSPTLGATSQGSNGSDGSIRGDLLASMRQQSGAV